MLVASVIFASGEIPPIALYRLLKSSSASSKAFFHDEYVYNIVQYLLHDMVFHRPLLISPIFFLAMSGALL